jgi:hypothetical protein
MVDLIPVDPIAECDRRDMSPVNGTGGPCSRSRSVHYIGETMRSILLWLIGIPLPIIIILWLVTGHA